MKFAALQVTGWSHICKRFCESSYYGTGFVKIQRNAARTEIHFIALHGSHTLALYRQTSKVDQVCFHRQHLSNHVNPLRVYGATGAH